jgi:hypothetical protein
MVTSVIASPQMLQHILTFEITQAKLRARGMCGQSYENLFLFKDKESLD